MQLIVGNWKMHGRLASVAIVEALVRAGPVEGVELLVCPPATLVARLAEAARGSHVAIGAQDCHPAPEGPFTGDIAAEMLADAGATHVIVGHSERRIGHAETDALVRDKASAAQRAGLVPIVCIGETLAEREAGETLSVVARQLAGSLPETGRFVVAYEPVWAIGTGRTPTPEQVAEVHAFVAARLPEGTPVLYGGSVKPENARGLLAVPHVGGALVGGASLTPRDFLAIAAAAPGAIA
ncbi:MAG: triose-phosphate isomerase [Thermaurantiacus tibetensis]|uniref:triose-phosphate isomerase n=1 Tax=Thermaurantiacus tibetensis TaxID=2759035 RepID=UPI00188F26C5|nr:triose-phosphate isomerase [Thermaurantiacus tibetensis]